MASLVVSIKGRELRRVSIEKPVVTIGRDASCDVTIDNIAVSRIHATLSFDGKGFSLEDAGSSNGVFVNGKKAEKISKLHMGDEILVLKHTVKLVADGGIDLSAARFTGQGDHSRHHHKDHGTKAPSASGKPVLRTMMMSDVDVAKLVAQKQQAQADEVEIESASGVPVAVAAGAVLVVLVGLLVVAYFATS